jgi:hypothetical protein
MRLQKKSMSRVSLLDLLRRKRTNLEKFLTDTGIVTYELLVSRCSSMGAVPPTLEQFLKAKGNPTTHEVSSPTEGIVVLNPPPPPKDTVETQEEPEYSPTNSTEEYAPSDFDSSDAVDSSLSKKTAKPKKKKTLDLS